MKKVFTLAVFSLFFVSLFAQSSSLEACEVSKDRIICSVGGNYSGKIIDETPDKVVILDRRGKKHFVPKVFIRRQKEICMDKKGRNGKRFSHALSVGYFLGRQAEELGYIYCGVGISYINEYYFKPKLAIQHQVAFSLRHGFDAQVGFGITKYDSYNPHYGFSATRQQSLYSVPFLIGLQKNFRVKKQFSPYINANIGKSLVNLHQMSALVLSEDRFEVEVNKAYTYQANLGCEYKILKNRAVFVEFGYWRQYLNFIQTVIPKRGNSYQSEDLKIYSDLKMKVGYRF